MAATAAKPATRSRAKASTTNGAIAQGTTLDLKVVPRNKIVVEDGFNPRTTMQEAELAELAGSIRQRGVLAPLVVTPIAGGKFKLLAGHRRVAAGDRVKLREYPVVVRDGKADAQLVDAIVDNGQRVDLTPLEEARAFGRLVNEHGLTAKGVAEACGVHQRLVTERLRILELPLDVQVHYGTGWLLPSTAAGFAQLASIDAELCSMIVALASADENSAQRRQYGHQGYHINRSTLHRKDGWYDCASSIARHTTGRVVLHANKESGGSIPGQWTSGHGFDPRLLVGLSKGVKDKLNALGSVVGHDHHYAYEVCIDQAILDALDAAKVLIRDPDDKSAGICKDLASLSALCEPVIEKDHKAWLRYAAKTDRAKTAAAAGDGKPATEQERADELAKTYKAQWAAHEANIKLGDQLTRHFGKTDLSMDATKVVCRMLLESVEVERLVKRGLRYLLPQWQQEITMKNGHKRLRVKGDGTKAPKNTDGSKAEGSLHDAFWEWWGLATTPQEVMGRTLIALAASVYADEDAIPQSRHAFWSLHPGGYGDRPQSVAMLKKLVAPKLPKGSKAES